MDENWKWQGEDYAKNSSSQFIRAIDALNQIGLKANWDVVDLGCGDGKITYFIAKNIFPGKTIGLDHDSSMIQKAKEFENKVKTLRFVQADAKSFQFDQQFDLITSFFCLQWIPKDALLFTFKNIHQHLKEGGAICFLLPCYDFPHEIIKSIAFSDKWKSYFADYHEPQTFLNTEYYQEVLQQTEFSESQVVEIESRHLLTDQEFVDFTRQWCGCYACIKDKKRQEEFIQDILNKLKQERHNTDGKFEMIQKSLKLIAKKSVLNISQAPRSLFRSRF